MVRSIVLRVSTALVVVLSAGVVLVVVGSSATATQGQPVIAGQTNTATSYTEVASTQPGVAALIGVNTGSTSTGVQGNGSSYGIRGIGPTGVYGSGTAGNGVWGETVVAAASGVYGSNSAAGNGVSGVAPTGNGVYGSGVTGVSGDGTTGVSGVGSANGVFGESSGVSGVFGQNDSTGYGTAGRSADGIGVYADSANGVALQVSGRATFSTAGTAVIASGKKSVTVTLAGVTTSDFVLATVQGSGAFYVKNASAGSGKFTININKAPTAPATVKVAYFVISAP